MACFNIISVDRTYEDVKKHARQIAEVTQSGYMPPWLPAGERGVFLNDRRLTAAQIERFKAWFEAGAPQGDPADLPPLPHWPEGWQLGEPDLVVRMPKKYLLEADGGDLYRNFVLPAAVAGPRHIRAVEFRPGNGRIVHHAFIRVDREGNSRRLDGADGQPGFKSMIMPPGVERPAGYFLSWQPGKMATPEPPGYGWTLQPGQDMVILAHLKRSGKAEELQSEVGLYFTDHAPTNSTLIFGLTSFTVDIPAGDTNYVVEDQMVVPTSVDILAVLPHAHYLARDMEAFAIRPGGAMESLLHIPDWDFNWQGEYRYVKPVHLPAGTLLRMRYRYDNSAGNARNPNSPPKEVRYGVQSSDEMAEFWMQGRLDTPAAAAVLKNAYEERLALKSAQDAEHRLQQNPHDLAARTELGFMQMRRGEKSAAMETFRAAVAENASAWQPHYYLGVLHREEHRLAEARAEFETVIRLDPGNARAHGHLGFIFMETGNLRRAERSLREALRLNPSDEVSRQQLEIIRQQAVEPR